MPSPEAAAHLQMGQRAERAADVYLRAQKHCHITANYRCRYGEIDLIMLDQRRGCPRCLVFVEVRYRRHQAYGGALESVTRAKQLKLQRSVEMYLEDTPRYLELDRRFDIIAISGEPSSFTIEWIENAF